MGGSGGLRGGVCWDDGLVGSKACTLHGGWLVGESLEERQIQGAFQGHEGRPVNMYGAPLHIFVEAFSAINSYDFRNSLFWLTPKTRREREEKLRES